MAPATRRSRAARIVATREGLIAAARAAFAKDGYAGASMDALCAEAGLTRGALYHHFGGKEGLLEAVTHQIDGELNARLDAVWEAEPDPWQGFLACCRAYLDYALEPEVQQILLRDAPAVLGQRLRDIDSASALEPTREALASLMALGRIQACDPEALARLINGATLEAALWIAASPDPAATRALAWNGLETLVRGLALLPADTETVHKG
jgi:AcrR family transcriptional regulator